MMKTLLALAAVAGGTAAYAQAPPQDLPTVLSPLRVETDHNGVNLVSGSTEIGLPTLSVPGAPNLRFDRVQNAAPYVVGKVSGGPGQPPVGNWSVHTGGAASESFVCSDWLDCGSVTGTGSNFQGPASSSGGNSTYRQAGTGAVFHFNLISISAGQTRQSYLSSINYPSGEAITYGYQTATIAWSGQIVYRPTTIASNQGYVIALSYQGNDFAGDPGSWSTVNQAAIYTCATPATPAGCVGATTPLGRLSYAQSGSVLTITDHGNRAASDPAGRVYTCSGCSNALGDQTQVQAGSTQLPGEGSPTRAVAALPSATLVGTVTQDGVPWSYSYTYNGGAPYLHLPSNSYWYTQLAITGPNGFNQIVNLSISGQRNVITSITDSIGRTTQYQFDTAYRPTRITLPEGNAVSVIYSDTGNVISRTMHAKTGSGLSNITETAVYPAAPNGLPNTCGVMCWRANSRLDALGRQTDYAYNGSGQLIEQTEPADANGIRRRTIVEYGLSASGINRPTVMRVCGVDVSGVNVTCGTNQEIRTEFDYWGNTSLPSAVRQVDASSGTVVTLQTSLTYDAAGRLLSTDGPLPGSDDATHNRYDVYGRKSWEIGPLGANGVRSARRLTYRDSDDRPVLVENGTVPNESSTTLTLINQTDYAYDGRRNAIRETVSASGTARGVVQRTFDNRNRLECEARRMNPAVFASLPASACDLGTQGTAPNDFGPDRITHNVYDNASQLLQIQRAYRITTANGFPATLQQNEATYTYSANGKQTSLTDANGNRAEMTWDGFDRQRRWIFPHAGAGAPNQCGSPGAANPCDYEEYGYDLVGNRLTLRRRDGLTLGFQYDNLNRLIVKTVPERAGLAATHTRDVHYGYDLRNAQLFARFDSAGASAEGVTNQYDGFGRLGSSTLLMDGVSRMVSHLYREDGARRRVTQPGGLGFTYTYDAAGRLTGIYQGDDTSIMLALYTYNPQGLPATRAERYASSITYGFDGVGQLTSQSDVIVGGANNVAFGFGHNPAGQITSRTRSNDAYAWTGAYNINRSYSANGLNQYTTAGTASFTYDANGNLTSDGSRTFTYDVENRLVGASGGVTLRYDPLGRLYEIAGPSETRRLVWDGDALINEYSAAGAMTARYVHGANPGADDPVVWYDMIRVNFLHADHQGSIVAVTNYAGPQSINRYDEWGIPAMNSAGENINTGRFQYTGQIWMPDLGMYHYKARIYSPTLGRFLQTDPVGYKGGVNLYGYTGNDPVNRADPTGLIDVYVGGASDEWMSELVLNYSRGTRSDGSPRNGMYVSFSGIEPAITAMREAYARGEPINVVGHSLGAKAAIELVARAGVPVNYLMTVDPVGGGNVSGAIYSARARRLTSYWLNVYADRSEGNGDGDWVAPLGRVALGNTLIPDDIESITTHRSHGQFEWMMSDVRADERLAASNARHRQRRRGRRGGGRGGGVCPDLRPDLQCAASVEIVN